MDFAKLMSSQIAQSKKSTAPSPSNTNGSAKYVRRGDLEAAREEAYFAEQKKKEAEREAKADKKRQLDEEEAEKEREREAKRQRIAEESRRRQAEEDEKLERERRKRLGLPELPSHNGEDGTPIPEDEDIPDDELTVKLRTISEPVKLFGETHQQRVRRYQKLVNPDAVVTVRKTDGPIPTTLEPIPEAEMKVPDKLPPASDKSARLHLSRQIASWFTLVLKEWGSALARRDEAVKQTFSGQAATTSMKQAIIHLKPLFRKLEHAPEDPSELPDDLYEPLVEIVRAAQERRYVHANDGYLELSIGKAAWPIGVTMVGIHERSAREKLNEGDAHKAHIMSDEETRKILQSIKRCLTYAQTRWPPDDIGQMMG